MIHVHIIHKYIYNIRYIMSMNVNQALFQYGSQRANPAYNLMNPIDIPYGAEPAEVTRQIRGATNTVNIEGRDGRKSYEVKPVFNPNSVPDNAGSRLREAIKVCEAVKTPDCNAFKNPQFAGTCMITHDVGRNSKGEAHAGGLVLFSEDREDQRNQNRGKGRYAHYNPTIGQSAQGKNSTDYNSCVAMDEKIRCEAQGNFGIPNCGMCMNGQGNFQRVDPSVNIVAPRLVAVGRGTITVTNASTNTKKAENLQLNTNSPVSIELDPESEGKSFFIEVKTQGTEKPLVAGFIEGPNSSGVTRLDLTFVCDNELVFGTKPVLFGSTSVEGEQVNYLTNASGNSRIARSGNQNEMKLNLNIPYTFLSSSEEEAALCPGGPYSMKESSVTFLSSDPCFKPNRPGEHKLECLQNKFLQAGCTVMGEGYPHDENLANQLRRINGTPQSLGSIAERIYNTSIEAATGIGAGGQKLSLEQWDEKSRWCTGKSITTPCAGYDVINGPLGDECIQYLFENGGAQKTEGRTYTLGQRFESLNTAGRQCTRNGAAAPFNQENLEKARRLGGVAEVKRYFNQMQLNAQNNNLSDSQRQEAIRDCYGVNLASAESQQMFNAVDPGQTQNISFGIPNSNKFVRHANFTTWHHPNDGSQLFKEDASWKIVPPLCGKPGYVSFEAVNYPNYYLINDNAMGKIVPREQTPEYNSRACWRATATMPNGKRMNMMDPSENLPGGAGCGLPGMMSLETAFTPGAFLRTAPGEKVDVFIPKNDQDRNTTCFQPKNGLSQRNSQR